MTRNTGLPRRVYLRHGRYYFVDLDGRWRPLTREKHGLPAMLRALATLTDTEAASDRMPAVITRWYDEKMAAGDWCDGMQDNMQRIAARLSARFAQFTPADVTAPVCAEYLRAYLPKPRTYNMHRSVLRQVLSFAALEGLRAGYNPADDVPQRKLTQRSRIVTDAEIARIKAALMTAARGGPAHCLMIDLAMMTGQRIGDVIRMRWQDVLDDGIAVRQGKTGAQMLIEWSPPLKAAIDACAEGRDRIGYLLVQSTGKPYLYAGIRSAWDRACAKAGVEDLHIHDLRGRAGADRADEAGIEAAQQLLGHDGIRMTEGYVRGKRLRRAKATGG